MGWREYGKWQNREESRFSARIYSNWRRTGVVFNSLRRNSSRPFGSPDFCHKLSLFTVLHGQVNSQGLRQVPQSWPTACGGGFY